MKLWLDDERDPSIYGMNFNIPDRASKILISFGREGWTWVKTVEEAKKLLQFSNENKQAVSVLSCDNDLGTPAEGYMLLNWLEEEVFNNPDFNTPKHIFFHSSNEARRTDAENAIKNIKRFKEQKNV